MQEFTLEFYISASTYAISKTFIFDANLQIKIIRVVRSFLNSGIIRDQREPWQKFFFSLVDILKLKTQPFDRLILKT